MSKEPEDARTPAEAEYEGRHPTSQLVLDYLAHLEEMFQDAREMLLAIEIGERLTGPAFAAAMRECADVHRDLGALMANITDTTTAGRKRV